MFYEKVLQQLSTGRPGDFLEFLNAEAPSAEARTKAIQAYVLDGYVRSRKGMEITEIQSDKALDDLGRALDELKAVC